MATKMTREEAIKIVQSATVWTDEERDALAMLIPGLKESEDERIRKHIIAYLRNELHNIKQLTPTTTEMERWLAYLEKQKEQKPAEWSEEDEKIITALTKALIGSDSAEKIMLFDGVTIEMVSDWLKSLSERLNLQPKQEWSEEDERILKGIIGKIDHDQTYGVSKVEMLSFLEDLRPSLKPSEVCYGPKGDPDPAGVWKPSEEQMNALYDILHPADTVNRLALKSLYEQLKAL